MTRDIDLLAEKIAVENVNDALGEIAELLERWENRLAINNLSLAERYVKKKCG